MKRILQVFIYFVIIILSLIAIVGLFFWYTGSIVINHNNSSINNLSEFLEYNDLKLMKITKTDLNKNKIDDYVVETMPIECGSCHSRQIYIIENGQIIFTYIGDSYSITNFGTVWFDEILKIKEPIRTESEPLCCPSEFKEGSIDCTPIFGISQCRVNNIHELK